MYNMMQGIEEIEIIKEIILNKTKFREAVF